MSHVPLFEPGPFFYNVLCRAGHKLERLSTCTPCRENQGKLGLPEGQDELQALIGTTRKTRFHFCKDFLDLNFTGNNIRYAPKKAFFFKELNSRFLMDSNPFATREFEVDPVQSDPVQTD